VAGSGPVIFTVCGVQSTAIICHDLRYPEVVRLAVGAGARIVFIANNEAGLERENKQLGYRSMHVSRATENYVFAVMTNAPADAEHFGRKNSSHGNSKIIDPLGNVLVEAGHFEERLITADIDLSQADGNTVRRVLGEDEKTWGRYGKGAEHPRLAAWLAEGVKLVTRLEPGNE
jgi:predicted amidohydrolase